jgi:Ca-activated chloride channel family protein
MLLSRLDIKALWDLAQAGGGVYRTLDTGAADTDAVLEFVDRRAEADQQSGQDVHVDQWRDGGVWLLPLLIPLAALGFRRGWLGLILLAVLAPVPQPAWALEWADLWRTPDQQAQQVLQSGDAKAAAERFADPDWKAAAEYKAGQFEAAAQHLEPRDTPLTQYNRGNALARQGQLESALKAYDRALELNPGHEDAQYNRKLVEEALKKQQEQQQKQDPSESSKEGDQGQQSNQDQKNQDGEKKPSQSQESQDQKPESSQAQQDKNQADSSANEEKSSGENDESKDPAKSAESQTGSTEGDPQQPKPDDGKQETAAKQDAAQQDAPAEPARPDAQEAQDAKDKPAAAAQAQEPPSESDQAEAQWLRRIPDDPGGLLKRKFNYQYRLRQQQQPSE